MQQSNSNSTNVFDDYNLNPTNPMGSSIQFTINPTSPEMQLLSYAQSNDKEHFTSLLNSNEFLLSNIQNQKNFTVLHYACFNNNEEMVKQIINYHERRSNNLENFINSTTHDKYTPLHFASYRGNLSILTLLKQKGANLRVTNNQGLNIMHIGAQGDQPTSIVFALDNGLLIADLDNNGGSALHWACYYGQEHSVNYLLPLLDNKNPYYPLNLIDTQGYTPLHLAVMNGNTRLVKKLIIYGADKTIKDKQGKTAANLAADNQFNNIYKLLTKKRWFFVSYYNLAQAAKRVRKSQKQLLRFVGFMLFILFSYYMYVNQNIILDSIIFGITAFLFILIVCKNPGYQIRRIESLLQLIDRYDQQEICPICNVVKLPRTKHCDICQQCVLVYDHHCPWINNCVGAGNHVYFVLFIFSILVSLIYIIIKTFQTFIEGNNCTIHFFESDIVYYFFMILSLIIESVFSLGMILLIYTQLTNIFMGQTTFERFAIQNNTSTLNSIMRPSNQNSLLDDQGSTTKQRLTKTSCKNFLTFATNGISYRKKERALLQQ